MLKAAARGKGYEVQLPVPLSSALKSLCRGCIVDDQHHCDMCHLAWGAAATLLLELTVMRPASSCIAC